MPGYFRVAVLAGRDGGIAFQVLEKVPTVSRSDRPAVAGTVERGDQHIGHGAAVVVHHLSAEVVDIRIRRRHRYRGIGTDGAQDGGNACLALGAGEQKPVLIHAGNLR